MHCSCFWLSGAQCTVIGILDANVASGISILHTPYSTGYSLDINMCTSHLSSYSPLEVAVSHATLQNPEIKHWHLGWMTFRGYLMEVTADWSSWSGKINHWIMIKERKGKSHQRLWMKATPIMRDIDWRFCQIHDAFAQFKCQLWKVLCGIILTSWAIWPFIMCLEPKRADSAEPGVIRGFSGVRGRTSQEGSVDGGEGVWWTRWGEKFNVFN